jgi:hypothetical protein
MTYNYILSGFNKCEYITVETIHNRSEFKQALRRGKVKFHSITLINQKLYGSKFRKSSQQALMSLNVFKKFGLVDKEEYNDGIFKITLYVPNIVFSKIINIAKKYGQHKNIELFELARLAIEEGNDYQILPEEIPVYEFQEGTHKAIIAGRECVIIKPRGILKGSGTWIRDFGNTEVYPKALW